jgi:ubiquinone/menaquinone biosynthesis C-methylase UbiE
LRPKAVFLPAMITPNWFEDWFNSPYYHQLYKHRDEEEAELFLQELITHLKPPAGARMIDWACGKGRHCKVLNDMGFDVTGVDLSEASIRAAVPDENEQLHFYRHDMRNPFRINYYDYAFNIFTSFGYFLTRREHDSAIHSMAVGLRKGGTLVMDYINVNKAGQDLPQSYLQQESAELVFQIAKWQDEHHIFKQIQVADAPGGTLRHLFTERVAKFTLHDFTDMMSYQGLQIREVFGDYQLASFDAATSPRLIIVADKIK